jgi:hypothetical protein
MPLWLRKFTFNKLKEWHAPPDEDAKENSWTKNSIAKEEASKNKKIQPPTYITKASKK